MAPHGGPYDHEHPTEDCTLVKHSGRHPLMMFRCDLSGSAQVVDCRRPSRLNPQSLNATLRSMTLPHFRTVAEYSRSKGAYTHPSGAMPPRIHGQGNIITYHQR